MRPQLTFRPDIDRPAAGCLVVYTPSGDDLSACESFLDVLGIASFTPSTARLAVPARGAVHATTLKVLLVDMVDALAPLLDAAHERGMPDSVRTFGLATRMALTAVASHKVMPHLHLPASEPVVQADEAAPTEGPQSATFGHRLITGIWRLDLDADPTLASATDRLVDAAPASAWALARTDELAWDPRRLVVAYMDAVADAFIRLHAPDPSGRPRERLLPWTTRWAEALGDTVDPVVPLKQEGPDLAAAIEGWQARTESDARLSLDLAAPDEPEGSWLLTFSVCDMEEVEHSAASVWEEPDHALTDTLLAGLSRAARVFPPLDAALADEAPTAITLDLDQAWQFIAESAPLLSGAGVSVTLPNTLDEDGIAAQIRLDTTQDGTVQATWEVSLDDRVLSDEEISTFLDADESLGFYGGRWVKIDEETRAALRARGRRETIGQAEALALALAGTTSDEWFGEGTAAARVVVDDRLAGLLDALRGAGELQEVALTPEGFEGELRPYQQRGVAWLRGMTQLGMGAVLADAMGLGKTIQLIGLLVSRPGPFIVVCPTSVVGNWEREINKFAPGLATLRHHGPDRPQDLTDFQGVLVTSYGTLRRDIELLESVQWDVVTLDEAQQVKNPATAAARAVRQLQARVVFALTGTPLENRLSELWAVIDATNRGLLGTRGTFSRRFVGPVEVRHNADAASRLRRLVSPFLMRRTKDDPEVAKDLPDKIERTVICSLTPEQAELYQRVTDESLAKLVDSDGMGRRGRILALLTALKQVTNHPAQYLKQPGPIAGRSGKMAVLRDIVDAVTDAGDAMLIFTQFTRMGDLLSLQLEADLGQPIPFLHGGLSLGQRDRMVEEFQQGGGSPVLLISTRAGGTGLNLTAATHVVHYDRWWNPAVEDQATDRAHRIGQNRTVEVHKLVTAGTLEERIAEMLDRKRALADAVVGAGETWITELDDDALIELVRLSADAPLTEPADAP
ncbi:MAG: DEAD/DEAH box helicase [Euzebya sp.]